MATSHFFLNRGLGQMAAPIKDTARNLLVQFNQLEAQFAAMTQAKDGNAGDNTDYVTPAAIIAAVANQAEATGGEPGSYSSAMAKAVYDEMNSVIGNCSASLKQYCAKMSG